MKLVRTYLLLTGLATVVVSVLSTYYILAGSGGTEIRRLRDFARVQNDQAIVDARFEAVASGYDQRSTDATILVLGVYCLGTLNLGFLLYLGTSKKYRSNQPVETTQAVARPARLT